MAEEEKRQQEPEVNPAQPGQVITPGVAVNNTAESPAPQSEPEPPAAPFQATIDEAHRVANAEEQPTSPDSISWTASEFIAHEKSPKWYFNLTIVAVVAAALIYLLTKDWISTAVVVFGALMLGVYGARQPRQLPYKLDSSGVQIGEKWHGYQEFRSFSIMPEGAFSSIVFMPLKRFAPLTTIYYAPEDEEKIVAILSGVLPYEERKHDPVDSLMQRIRF